MVALGPGTCEQSAGAQAEIQGMSRAWLSSDACRSSRSQWQHLPATPGTLFSQCFLSPLPAHWRGDSILWGKECRPVTAFKVTKLDLNQVI